MAHNQVEYRGRIIDCYGDLEEDSNFEVVCEDEDNDGCWTDGNPNNAEGLFQDWTEVVDVLCGMFPEVVEIVAC